MPDYTAVFILVDGLEETDIGHHYRLDATSRSEAETEALSLTPPDNANFIKLLKNGRFEGPKLGFSL